MILDTLYFCPFCLSEVELGVCEYVFCDCHENAISINDLISETPLRKTNKDIFKHKKFQSGLRKVREPKKFTNNYKH
jgi:hypothetical protein